MDTRNELNLISKGTIFALSGNGLRVVLEFVLITLIAKFSGPEVAGIYFLAVAIINVLAIVAQLGLGEGLLRFVSIYNGIGALNKAKASFISAFLITFGFGFIISLILFFNAKFLSIILNRANLDILFRYFAFSLPFVALSRIYFSFFQAFHSMKETAFMQGFLGPFSTIIFYLILVWFKGETIAIGIAYTLSYFLLTLVSVKQILNRFGKQVHMDFSEVKKLINFSLPVTFVGLFFLVYGQVDTILLGWFGGAAQVGVFGVVFKISLICIAFISSINYIFSPIVADLHARGEAKKLEKVFKSVTRWTIILSLPIYLIIIINGKAILLFFGESYIVGLLPLILLCSGRVIDFSTGLGASILTMSGRSFLAMFNSIIFIVLNIVLDLFLIPEYGILGAAIGSASALSIINFLRLIQIYYLFKIHPFSLRILVPITSIFIICISILFLRRNYYGGMTGSIIYTILGLLTYSFIMFLNIHKDDQETFRYIVERIFGKAKGVWQSMAKITE